MGECVAEQLIGECEAERSLCEFVGEEIIAEFEFLAEKEIGEIRYKLKPGITLDAAKMSKIEKAVADTGRSIEPTPIK